MKNRSFEYVYTVFQEGSFSKAAAKLYISQPPLTAFLASARDLTCRIISVWIIVSAAVNP